MSAWMFTPTGVNRVVDAVRWSQKHRIMWQGPAPFVEFFDDDNDKLGMALLRMNAESLLQRYNDPLKENMPASYTYEPSGADPIQLLKTVECFLYQCAEGNVPDTPLFKKVDDVAKTLSFRVDLAGHDKAAYDAAHWG